MCEDHPLNREITVKILDKEKVKVETASNGKMGLSMLNGAPSGYYDLILMDIRMPVMDGLETTKAIRSLPDKSLASIPIIALTANAFDTDVQACIEAGMNAHLSKPLDPKLLIKTITEFLSR